MKLSSEMKAALMGAVCFLLSFHPTRLVLMDTISFPLNQPRVSASKVVPIPPNRNPQLVLVPCQSGSCFTGQSCTPLFP